jgi:outer membrane protein assembly factor BamB
MKIRVALMGLCSVMLLGGCSTAPSVKEPTSLAPLDPIYALKKNWQVKTGIMPNRDSEGLFFAEDDSNLYTATATGYLVALTKELKTRWKDQVLWQAKFASEIVSGPAKQGDQLIIGTAKGLLTSLSAKHSQIKWQTQLSSEVMSYPVIAQQTIFTRTVDGKLYAVNAVTGEVIWIVEHEMPSLSLRGSPAVLYYENALYVAWESGMIQALSASSGTLLWERRIATPKGRTDLERIVDVQASLVMKEGRLIALGYHGKLVAINPSNGQFFFEKPLSGYRDFVVDSDRIYVVDDTDVLYAFDLFSGAMQWTQSAFKGRLVGDLSFYQGDLLVSDGWGYLHWLNRVQGTEYARVKHSNEYGDGNRILRIKVDNKRLTLLDAEGLITQYDVEPSNLALFKKIHPPSSEAGFFDTFF